MKKFILLFMLFVIGFTNAQDSNTEFLNFKLTEDKDIIWQKIYEINYSIKEMESFFKGNDFTAKLVFQDSTFIGRSGKSELSNKKNVAIAAQQKYDVFIKIELKDKRYRVTLSNLEFDATDLTINSGMFAIGQSLKFDLNDVSVRENHHEIRRNKSVRDMLTTFDSDFDKHFVIKKDKKDNW